MPDHRVVIRFMMLRIGSEAPFDPKANFDAYSILDFTVTAPLSPVVHEIEARDDS